MNKGFTSTRRGDSLLEILAVVTCIAILAVIAVVANTGRAEKAAAAQAKAEVEALAKAQQAVAADTGAFVPLQLLDDPRRQGNQSGRGIDDISGEPGTIKGIDPSLVPGSQVGEQPALAGIAEKWKGPYYEFRRTHVGKPAEAKGDWVGEVVRRDWPLDPWGTPYRFYTPAGLVGTDAAKTTPEAMNTDAFGDGVIVAAEDRFDSFAIVSFGPDGLSDTVSNGNDDVIYLFQTEGVR